jgi:hypothetical protein
MRLPKRRTEPEADGYLTYFTADEATELRRLVALSFASAGRDVDVYPDRIEDSGGTTIGLWNIGALCARADRHDWPALIDEHVRLVTAPPRHIADLSPEELEAGLCLRLVDTASVADPDGLGHSRIVAPGLREVLSVDMGDAMVTPSRDELEGREAIGWLLARARANLRAVLADGDLRAESVGADPDGLFTAVTGRSRLTASLALLLPETVEHFTGGDDWGRGVLVAVPFRHQLMYRPIDGPEAELALQHMLRAAQDSFHVGAGPLCPDVFWVRNSIWVQVSSSADGKPRLLRGTGVGEALASV